MRNAHVEAQRRATKEYYPPHLTGHGSRGLGLLDMIFFDLDSSKTLTFTLRVSIVKKYMKSTHAENYGFL